MKAQLAKAYNNKKQKEKEVVDIESEEEMSPVKNKARKAPAKTTAKTSKRRNSDDEEEEKKKKVKKDTMKHDAVMVIYKIDDSLPELKESFHDRAGSVLLSDLFDLNPDITRSDVRMF